MLGGRTRIFAAATAIFATSGALALFAGPALAQDFGLGPQRDPTLTTSRLGVESIYASFDQQGVRGEYAGVTVRGDLRLDHRVGIRLLVPTYAIHLDGDGQGTSIGLGDAELRVRVLIYDGHPWRFYAGLAEQLPTGDTTMGLGQGGSQLAPFATGGWRTGKVVVFVSVQDCIGLHPRGKAMLPDWVDPSSDHELRANVGVLGEISEPIYLSGALASVTDLEPGDLGTSLLYGSAAVGWVINDAFKLVLLGQAPFAGAHRFEEKLGLNAYWYF